MVDLSVGFKTFYNLLIFLLLAIIDILWIYRSLKKKSNFSLTPFILINVLLFLTWGWLVGICHDTSEHFHCAWMVSQGLVPFKDFWQHHPPFLWIILAPLFKILKPTVLIFELSRIFSVLIFTAIAFIGWQISKNVLQEKAKLPMYLLILFSSGTSGQFLWFRPDLFMYLFLLVGINFSLKIPDKKISPPFFAGISFALAASFIFKQYLLYLLPIIIILLEKNGVPPSTLRRDKFRVGKLLVYFAGLAVVSLPLVFYLIRKDILSEFIFWVFKFNRERITVLANFPIAIWFMGGWGAYLLLSRYRKLRDTKALILFIAFCLSTLSSLTSSTFYYSFYLGFWFILCAIVSSGCDIIEISKKAPSLIKKSVGLGLFFSLLMTPNFIDSMKHGETFFSEDKKTVSKLIKYCAGDTCVVFLPLHPIFNYDATRLYSDWQFFLIDTVLPLQKDAESKNIAQAIINLRPAVIAHTVRNKDFLLDLFLKFLISKEEFKKLDAFFEKNYTVKSIGKGSYYIRNDKL